MARPSTPPSPADGNVIPLPEGRARTRHLRLIFDNKLRKQLADGMMWLNPQERQLIELCRHTSFTGRDHILTAAAAINRTHPWRYDAPSKPKPKRAPARKPVAKGD